MALLLLLLWCAVCGAEASLCEQLRIAFDEAASAGLRFYAAGLPSGAARSADRSSDLVAAQSAYREAVLRLADVEDAGGFERCLPPSRPGRVAAVISHTLVLLLVEGDRETRRTKLNSPDFALEFILLFSLEISWSDVLHSGWPVFRLAALVEHEVRHPSSESLTNLQLYRQDSRCDDTEETFRENMVLLSGEGRTSRVVELRRFLRHSFHGDDASFEAGELDLDIIYREQKVPGACPAAMAVAFAALADALQCHWHRPRFRRTHHLADAAVRRAQIFVAQTWAPSDLVAFFGSGWPLLQYLGRLQPPSEISGWAPGAWEPALVSWSSREAELGGSNWAANFAEQVFGSSPTFALREDVECADIFLYRAKLPANFGGVLIFVDGERGPDDSEYLQLLSSYPASIVIGPLPAGGFSKTFLVPYASACFAHREAATPATLLEARQAPASGARRFAAYLAFKCWPHREEFYGLLNAEARANGLGGVDALSRCGNDTAIDIAREGRYSRNYQDDAAAIFSRYRFALVFENRLSQRYVTEKIVNAFLGGAIPIYWGSPFVLRIFNPASFIYVNHFTSFRAAVRRVIDIERDPELYASYATAPILQDSTEARWIFTWHRTAPSLPQGVRPLREEIVTETLARHEAGVRGPTPAAELRLWDHSWLFETILF